MKNTLKQTKIILALFIFILFLSILTKILFDTNNKKNNYLRRRSYYIERNINSINKLWLNGYLGIFFRFKDFGYLNILMILVLFYYIFTIEQKERWQKALFFVYLLSVILIGYKGYKNFRYAFSLFPFTICAILLVLWEIYQKVDRKYKILLLGIVILFIGYGFFENVYIYYNHYIRKVTKSSSGNIDKVYDMEALYNIIKKLNINEQNNILIGDVPGFFYYTDVKGITIKNIQFRKNKTEKLYKEMKDEFKINYIVVDDKDLTMYKNLNVVVRKYGKQLLKIRSVSLFELSSKKFYNMKALCSIIKELGINEQNNILIGYIPGFFYYTDVKGITLKKIRIKKYKTGKLYKKMKDDFKINYIVVDDKDLAMYENLKTVVQKYGKKIIKIQSVSLFELTPTNSK